MTSVEINTLAINIICHVCNVDEDKIYIGWQTNPLEKLFFIVCYKKAEAELISKMMDGHIEEVRGTYLINHDYWQVVIPLGNVFR